jgi:hypothetical protein
MADIPFPTNLLPQYQSPQAMAASAASTQQTQAQTGLLGAQTQSADIANQGAALKLGLLQNYYRNNQQPGGSSQQPSSTSGETVGGTTFSPDDVTSGIISKYAPIPTAPPPSAVAQDAYARSIGAPELAVATYKAQVDGANQQRQLGANSTYQMAEQVANAPPGAAFETLNRYNPQAAAAFKQSHPSDDATQLDADARLLAQHTGIAVHQYTGRDTDFQNGVLVDKKDGSPVLGSKQVLTGLDAAGKQKAFDDANSPITLADGLPGRKFQESIDPSTGRPYTSAEAYVIAADRAARSSAAAPAAPGADAPAGAPRMIQPASTSGGTTPQGSVTPTATSDPQLRAALTDTSFRYQPPPAPKNQSDLAANTDQAKANVASRQTLKVDSDDATKAASQAQTYLQAAQSVMDSKGATVGAYGALVAKASALGLGPIADATNYQEVAKYLGNAALANARGIYGNRMTQSEVGLQLNELSPSVHMTDSAINNLLATNQKAAQYTIDSAKRVVPYLAAGNDATNFGKWNQQYWNQSNTVNGPRPARPGQQTSGAAPTVVRTGTLNGRKVVQYSDGSTAYAQ